MKIRQLNLAAFGPFTDKILDFDQASLHIVYGLNEAGKSSSLRGLKALLYGIQERTPDNFLHANDKLRVQGSLLTAAGHELLAVRRKGRKNTLLTPAGEALDEQALRPFLQGVTPELFETLFGIDHQELLRGGQEILDQKGEVGQALFSAAIGSQALHAVLVNLEEEAKGLFLPGGSKPAINSAIRAHLEMRRELRNCSLSSSAWDAQRRAVDRTASELEKIQSELAEHRVEANRLQRIQRVLPKLARRRGLLKELDAMVDVVTLARDFAERRQQAVSELGKAKAVAGKATPRLERLQEQLEGLPLNQALLEQAENIVQLHEKLGGQRKALEDRPRLAAEEQQLQKDVESILKEVRPDLERKDIEELRPVLARQQDITKLGNEKEILITHVKTAESRLRETAKRLKVANRKRSEIPESGSPEALRRALAAARKPGDLDASIQSHQSKITSLRTECAARLSRLAIKDCVLEDLAGLGMPNLESIRLFVDAYDQLGKRVQRLAEKRDEVADSLQATSLKLDEIQRKGEVPTEANLREVRAERDRGWQLLRRQWLGGEDLAAEASDFRGEKTLPDAFESRLAEADDVSDRLRREVGRVHELASLEAKKKAGRLQTEEFAGQLAAYDIEQEKLDTDWRELWASCRITPRTPREMRAWLDDFEGLRVLVKELNFLDLQLVGLEQDRKTHIRLLNQELVALGRDGSLSGGMEAVLLECDALARQLDESRQERSSLADQINSLAADEESFTEEHQSATTALEGWQTQWAGLMQGFGLQDEFSPSEMSDFIEQLRTLFKKQDEAENWRARIQAIDRDALTFRGQVQSMVAAIAPKIAELPADDAVIRLNSQLSKNRTSLEKRRQIEGQIKQAESEVRDSSATIQAMTELLDALCAEAKCEHHHELEQAERSSVAYLRLKSELDMIEQEIVESGEGAGVAELEVEAGEMDPDLLPARIKELNQRIGDELEPRRTELAETLGRAKKELELMDGGDQAALHADRAQAELAGIRANAERYVQVKLAGKILRDQIERYRKENQGPLVERASEHFSTLTLGSFERLMTDFDEKDEPVLAGIRANGKQVWVEGMSNGTRDQLYLALRLASLEKYMESAEPMPFIVDDVLVDFDDERAQAALRALSSLAQKTQVILFTHHLQVVEQARRLPGPVQVHEL